MSDLTRNFIRELEETGERFDRQTETVIALLVDDGASDQVLDALLQRRIEAKIAIANMVTEAAMTRRDLEKPKQPMAVLAISDAEWDFLTGSDTGPTYHQ